MGALSRPADHDARQAHARSGGFRVPGRHGPPVPAHPHPNPAERRADGGAAEREGSQRGADAGRGASWIHFAQVARRYSEDPGSKSKGGYLPATPRGQFVPAFDSAAWTLPPGAMTAVVRTPFGFHIIRRPPLAEVRDSFRVDLENSRTAQLDSL